MLRFHVESWIWYPFVTMIVLTRFASRITILGSPKRLQVEDYLMAFVFVLYTLLIVFLNIVLNEQTNLMLPEEIPLLTPQSIHDRTIGSKEILLVEQCMCAIIWGCKGCLLLMYWRLTFGLKQNVATKIIAVYVAVTFVIMEILYFAYWCRPFHEYWAVPTNNLQCSTATHHLAVNLAFNLSSDLMIMSVPLPMLVRMKLPLVKKIALCSLFSLGFFIMVCSILSKYYSFTNPFSTIWEWWYCREASTAVCVVNIPYCWALWRRIFHLRAFFQKGNGTISGHSPPNGGTASSNARQGSGTLPDLPMSHLGSQPSPTEPSKQFAPETSADMKEVDVGMADEKRGGSDSGRSTDVCQSRLEMELRMMEEP